MNFFAKKAIPLLSGILLLVLGFHYLPDSVSTMKRNDSQKLPIYCVETGEKKAALTFDAAWGNEDTQKILDILEKNDVKATFFITGAFIETYPEDVKTIAAAGHDIGNHSENHRQMSQLSKKECIREIMKLHEKVRELTGIEMKLFRPPYGDYNNTLMDAVEECGYYGILWDVDSLDWKNYGVDTIIRTVVEHEHLGNGSIILMHNGASETKDALSPLIKGLRKKGYELVPVSELMVKEDYHMDQEGRQCPD